jgi:hypothetical protein
MWRPSLSLIPLFVMILGLVIGGCDQHSIEAPQPSSRPASQPVTATVVNIATSKPSHATQDSSPSRPSSPVLVSKSWRVRLISAGNAIVACHDFGNLANTALLGVMVEVENIGENIGDLSPSRVCLVAEGGASQPPLALLVASAKGNVHGTMVGMPLIGKISIGHQDYSALSLGEIGNKPMFEAGSVGVSFALRRGAFSSRYRFQDFDSFDENSWIVYRCWPNAPSTTSASQPSIDSDLVLVQYPAMPAFDHPAITSVVLGLALTGKAKWKNEYVTRNKSHYAYDDLKDSFVVPTTFGTLRMGPRGSARMGLIFDAAIRTNLRLRIEDSETPLTTLQNQR